MSAHSHHKRALLSILNQLLHIKKGAVAPL